MLLTVGHRPTVSVFGFFKSIFFTIMSVSSKVHNEPIPLMALLVLDYWYTVHNFIRSEKNKQNQTTAM